MLTPDEDGRYPLNAREYEALRQLFAFDNALDRMEALHDRLKLIKTGNRDIAMMGKVNHKLLEELLRTIPTKKLKAMRDEMKRSIVELRLKGSVTVTADDLLVAPVDAVVKIMDRAIQMDCTFCAKSAIEGRKCDLYRALMECLPYEMAKRADGACPLSGSACLEDTKP